MNYKIVYSLLLLIVLLQLSCDNTNKYSKSQHLKTIKIDDNLYSEIYKIYSGGVYGGDVYSRYITDSTSFRKLLGTYYDHEEILTCIIENNMILSYKVDINTYDVSEAKIYDISNLKKFD